MRSKVSHVLISSFLTAARIWKLTVAYAFVMVLVEFFACWGIFHVVCALFCGPLLCVGSLRTFASRRHLIESCVAIVKTARTVFTYTVQT